MKRRSFLAGALSTIAPCAFAGERDDFRPVMPPGVPELSHLLNRCTGCGLCVGVCENKVLKGAFLEYGLRGVSMPVMDFSRNGCSASCTRCGEVCPAGAILPLTKEEKRKRRIGMCVHERDKCVVKRDEVSCGLCAKRCPSNAIIMEKAADGREYPLVDFAKCTGCGICESYCPGKAMRVNGLEKQETGA